MKRLIIIAAVLAITAACGGNPTVVHNPNNTSTITNLDPAGNYLITLTDSNSNSYQISGWLSEVNPPNVTTTFFYHVEPDSCVNSGLTFNSMSGAVSGSNFNPILTTSWNNNGAASIVMSTTVASTQDAFSGTYSLSSLPEWCLPINITSSTGTVSAKQLPEVSGTYTGTFTDSSGNTVQVSFAPQMDTNPSSEAGLTMGDGTLIAGGFTGGTISVSGDKVCGFSSTTGTFVVPSSGTVVPVYPKVVGAQRGEYVVLSSKDNSGITTLGMYGVMNAAGTSIAFSGRPNSFTTPYGLYIVTTDASGEHCTDTYSGTISN